MAWKQTVNKPTAKPVAPKPKFETKDDDWETDTAYQVFEFQRCKIIVKPFQIE